jgi:predicted Zn-dependent protease
MRINTWKSVLPLALSFFIAHADHARAETGFEDLILNGVKTGPLKAKPQQQPSLQNSRSVATSRDDAETRGDAAYKAGKYLDAAMFYNAGITSYDDKYAPLYIKRARALAQLQRNAEALSMLDKAKSVDPQIMQQKDNQDLQNKVLASIKSSHANSSDTPPPAAIKALMTQGTASECKKNYAAALVDYEKALKIDRSYGGLFASLARCYLALDDKQKAVLAADWLAETGKKSRRPGDLAYAATICNAAGRHDRAAAISANGLEIAQTLEIKDEEIVNDLAAQKAIAGAHIDLVDCDQTIKSLQDKKALLQVSLALMARNAAVGNNKLIEDEYSKALDLDASKLRAHATAFDAYIFGKNPQQAFAAGQKAFEIDGEPRFLLAEHDRLIAQKNLNEALPLIDKIIQSQPGYSKYRIYRASNLHQQGRAADALKDLALVLQAEPDNEQALGFRASIAASQNDFATCFADSQRMSELNPDSQRWYKNAVRAGLRAARFADVERIAQKGLTKFGFDDDLKSAKALSLMAQGGKKLSEAQTYLEHECEIKPQDGLLFALRAQALYKQGKAVEASRMLAEFIKHGYPDPDRYLSRLLAIKAGLALQMGDYKSAADDLAALAGTMNADSQSARRSLYFYAAANVCRIAGDQGKAAQFESESDNIKSKSVSDKDQDKQIAAMRAAFAKISSDRSKNAGLFKAVPPAGPHYIDETTIESDIVDALNGGSGSGLIQGYSYVLHAFS